jgi:hypothetical protein
MAWNGLVAELYDDPERRDSDEQRREMRLRLRFEASLADLRGPSDAVVLDLSRAGFLIHTSQALGVGDIVTVDLPEAGPINAQVVWKRQTLHGCKFTMPVSRAVISATLLKASPNRGPRSESEAEP